MSFIEEKSFPAALVEEVRALIPRLGRDQMHPPTEGFQVEVAGENLAIPYRVYYSRLQVRAAMGHGGNQGAIGSCLGTRHHDGYLREECVGQLLSVDEPWVVPFVVQLLGEYVLEIVQLIEKYLPERNIELYLEYIRNNEPRFKTIERRAISYWDAYYRAKYPVLVEYPPYRLVSNLRTAAKRSNRSLEPTSVGKPPSAAQLQR